MEPLIALPQVIKKLDTVSGDLDDMIDILTVLREELELTNNTLDEQLQVLENIK